MADTPESKSPFWSSLPGIFTGLGGLIVASTGLITALYSTGVIGSNANSNAVPPVNTAVALASVPTVSPSIIPDIDRYKALAGKWEVVEEPSQDFSNVENVTWHYDATMSGNVLTLTGSIWSIDDDKNLTDKEGRISAVFVANLKDLSGEAEYRVKKMDGSIWTNKATIQLDADLRKFESKIDVKGKRSTYRLSGRKL